MNFLDETLKYKLINITTHKKPIKEKNIMVFEEANNDSWDSVKLKILNLSYC